MDAANILIPALALGAIRLMGATNCSAICENCYKPSLLIEPV